MNTQGLTKMSYGLFVLTSAYEGKDNGCIINTAIQITNEPLCISIVVVKTNLTQELITKSGKFNLSILNEAADFNLFKHFGFQSGREVNKFAEYSDCKRSNNGLYYITQGTNAYLSAVVQQRIDLGSHILFIANLQDMEVLNDIPSATYAYYHTHIKPKPVQQVSNGKTAWRCSICGYVYENEILPEDYICPLCKHLASDFEKITID